jgi:hypothetical protein
MSTPNFRAKIPAIIAVTIIGLFAALVYRFVRTSREAQYTRSAYFLVLDVLGDYLAQNRGKWPKSWDDLVQVPNSGVSDFKWPEDVARIQKRIRIDFDLTTPDVISAGITHFTAVMQVHEPNYGADPYLINRLLYRAQLAVGQKGQPDS